MIIQVDYKCLFKENLILNNLNEAKTITNSSKNALKLGTQVSIEVRDNEGSYEPHFHVSNNEHGNKRIDTCVKIYDNRFFSHGKHILEFNSSYFKDLDNWLSKKYYKLINGIEMTNWEVIEYTWRIAYGLHPTATSIKPDYTTIKPTK